MASQTILFPSPEGETLTLQLRAIGASEIVASAAATVVSPGRYSAEFTDLAPASYIYTAVRTSGGSAVMTDTITTLAETGYYLGTSEAGTGTGGATQEKQDELLEGQEAIKQKLAGPVTFVHTAVIAGKPVKLYYYDTHDGTRQQKLSFTVEKDYTDVPIQFVIFDRSEYTKKYLTADATVESPTLISVTTTVRFPTTTPKFSGTPQTAKCFCALVAVESAEPTDQETIVFKDCHIIARPDLSGS